MLKSFLCPAYSCVTSFRFQGFLCAFSVLVLDQMSKWWVSTHLLHFSWTKVVSLTSFLDFVLVYNRGISFGLFSDAPAFSGILLIGMTMIVGVLLSFWIWKSSTWGMSMSLALILGGALGNLADRIRFSWVIDFIYFHWHSYSFPAFNVADSAITLGAAGLVIMNMFRPPAPAKEKKGGERKKQGFIQS